MKDNLVFKWVYWPSLQDELAQYSDFLSGHVLNAGAGFRKINFSKVEKWTNVDIEQFEGVDIVSDLEKIPVEESTFDGMLSVAVLEHVRRPWKVVEEARRVLKNGGKVICAVPFMQPIHLVPTDYFRVTPDGLKSLFEDNGFKIKEVNYTHSFFHILGWFIEDSLRDKTPLLQYALWPFAKLCFYLTKNFPHLNIRTAPSVVTLLAELEK